MNAVYAACTNCRFSEATGCAKGNTPDVDGLRCEEYEMTAEFLEAIMEELRGDFAAKMVYRPETGQLDLPAGITR